MNESLTSQTLNPLLDLFVSSDLDVTSANVKDFVVHPCTMREIKEFVVHWHYSHNLRGMMCSQAFKLTYRHSLIGAMIYGRPAMANAWKKYADHQEDLLELRRLCCIDKTPRNTESYFIGKTLKWLKRNTDLKVIVSYADPHYGHGGIIYRASNFEYHGQTSPGKVISYKGRLFHDKCIRDGKKKDVNGNQILDKYAIELIEALKTGEAQWMNTPGKHIYIYSLKS
jgi:hypothetical protein